MEPEERLSQPFRLNCAPGAQPVPSLELFEPSHRCPVYPTWDIKGQNCCQEVPGIPQLLSNRYQLPNLLMLQSTCSPIHTHTCLPPHRRETWVSHMESLSGMLSALTQPGMRSPSCHGCTLLPSLLFVPCFVSKPQAQLFRKLKGTCSRQRKL